MSVWSETGLEPPRNPYRPSTDLGVALQGLREIASYLWTSDRRLDLDRVQGIARETLMAMGFDDRPLCHDCGAPGCQGNADHQRFCEDCANHVCTMLGRCERAASVDTHPKDGDSTKIEAPLVSGAVPEGQTPNPRGDSSHD